MLTSLGIDAPATGPPGYSLLDNYPNPFNPATNIRFSLPARELVTLKVYDALGREVSTLVNSVKDPGTYTVRFDGSRLASGVYFYRLEAFAAGKNSRGFSGSGRMLLLR
jgi:hypothetical protein